MTHSEGAILGNRLSLLSTNGEKNIFLHNATHRLSVKIGYKIGILLLTK